MNPTRASAEAARMSNMEKAWYTARLEPDWGEVGFFAMGGDVDSTRSLSIDHARGAIGGDDTYILIYRFDRDVFSTRYQIVESFRVPRT